MVGTRSELLCVPGFAREENGSQDPAFLLLEPQDQQPEV